MAPIKEQLTTMIDLLPESEQLLLLEIVRRFLPDDVASYEDLEDIRQARLEYRNGETVPHDAVNWD